MTGISAVNSDQKETGIESGNLIPVPLQHDRNVVARLDQRYLNRFKGCSQELRKVREGISGVIRENLSNKAVARIINDQLMQISETEVDTIVVSFPEKYQQAARTVLAVISQFSTYDSLSEFPAALKPHDLLEKESLCSSAVYNAGAGSLSDVIAYLNNKKDYFYLSPLNFDDKLSSADVVLVEQRLLSKIAADQSFAQELASRPRTYVVPLAFYGAITPFNTPLPSQIAMKVEEVLQDCLVLTDLMEEHSQEVLLQDKEALESTINSLLRMNADSALRGAFSKQWCEPCSSSKTTYMTLNLPEGGRPLDSDAICERLNGQRIISNQAAEVLLDDIPQEYHPLAREMLAQESYVLSERSIAVAAGTFSDRVRQIAQQKGVSDKDIYMYVESGCRSLSVVGQAMRAQFGIQPENILTADYPVEISELPENSICIIADDFIGSGASVNSLINEVRCRAYPGSLYLFSAIANKKSHRLGETFGETLLKDRKVFSLPGQKIDPFSETDLYGSSCGKGQEFLSMLTGYSGYGSSSLMVCMPYMVPDNTCGFFGKTVGSLIVRERSNKSNAYCRPDEGRLGSEIKSVLSTARDFQKDLQEAGVSIDSSSFADMINQMDLMGMLTERSGEKYSDQLSELRGVRGIILQAFKTQLPAELDRLTERIRISEDLGEFKEMASAMQKIFSLRKVFEAEQPEDFIRLSKLREDMRGRTLQLVSQKAEYLFRSQHASSFCKLDEYNRDVPELISWADKVEKGLNLRAEKIIRRIYLDVEPELVGSIYRDLNRGLEKSRSLKMSDLRSGAVSSDRSGTAVKGLEKLGMTLNFRQKQLDTVANLKAKITLVEAFQMVKLRILESESVDPDNMTDHLERVLGRLPEFLRSSRLLFQDGADNISEPLEKLSESLQSSICYYRQFLTGERRGFNDLIELNDFHNRMSDGVEKIIELVPDQAGLLLAEFCEFDRLFGERFERQFAESATEYRDKLISSPSESAKLIVLFTNAGPYFETLTAYPGTEKIAVQLLGHLAKVLPDLVKDKIFDLGTKENRSNLKALHWAISGTTMWHLRKSLENPFVEAECSEFLTEIKSAREVAAHAFFSVDNRLLGRTPALLSEPDSLNWKANFAALGYHSSIKRFVEHLEEMDTVSDAYKQRILCKIASRETEMAAGFRNTLEALKEKLETDPGKVFESLDERSICSIELLNSDGLAEYFLKYWHDVEWIKDLREKVETEFVEHACLLVKGSLEELFQQMTDLRNPVDPADPVRESEIEDLFQQVSSIDDLSEHMKCEELFKENFDLLSRAFLNRVLKLNQSKFKEIVNRAVSVTGETDKDTWSKSYDEIGTLSAWNRMIQEQDWVSQDFIDMRMNFGHKPLQNYFDNRIEVAAILAGENEDNGSALISMAAAVESLKALISKVDSSIVVKLFIRKEKQALSRLMGVIGCRVESRLGELKEKDDTASLGKKGMLRSTLLGLKTLDLPENDELNKIAEKFKILDRKNKIAEDFSTLEFSGSYRSVTDSVRFG